MVSLALFAIIVAIAIGGFVQALRATQETQLLLAANSNASLALEQIARDIRTGTDFCNGSPCPPANDAAAVSEYQQNTLPSRIAFQNADGETIFYDALTNPGRITEGSCTASRSNYACAADASHSDPITGDNVRVNSLLFFRHGELAGDGYPARVTILLDVSPSSSDPAVAGSHINLETTVSARNISASD